MGEKISEIDMALSGQLIVGNHELLDIYGIDAQNQLREASKNIASVLLYGNDELETNIAQLMDSLDEIGDEEPKDKSNGVRSRSVRDKNFKKKYQDILDYIDELTLLLQLQEARLLKDNVILDNYAEQVTECKQELSKYIDYAKKLHYQTIEKDKEDDADNNDDIKNWADRLQKRIEALETSHVVALQSEQELAMLKENNRLLLDKINDAISNTIPLWQMQVTISLGLEKRKNNQKFQDDIIHKTNAYLNQNRKEIKKQTKKKDVSADIEILMDSNKKLQKILEDLNDMEAKDKSIKNAIVKLQ